MSDSKTRQKDPAFLFYSSDFLTGVMFLTDEETGIYIKLLCSQHQNGFIPADIFDLKVGEKTRVREKFTTDENGNYYNERLRYESERRKSYTESRRQNRLKKNVQNTSDLQHMNNISKTYDTTYDTSHEKHMIQHMENENENENIIRDTVIESKERKKQKKKESGSCTLEEAIAFANEKGYNSEFGTKFWNYYSGNDWVDRDNKKVKNWKGRMNSWIGREENDRYKIATPIKPDDSLSVENCKNLEGFNLTAHTCGIYKIEVKGGKVTYTPPK